MIRMAKLSINSNHPVLPGMEALMAERQPESNVVRIPLIRYELFGLQRYWIPVPLLLRAADGRFKKQVFLLDDGTTLTHLSLSFADRVGLPYRTDQPLRTATIMGRKQHGGFRSTLRFALADMPQWQFTTQACFSADEPPGKVPLLSGSDLLNHFTVVQSAAPHPHYPDGFLLLHLRDDHGGVPTPAPRR
jgi:hypothetical protein